MNKRNQSLKKQQARPNNMEKNPNLNLIILDKLRNFLLKTLRDLIEKSLITRYQKRTIHVFRQRKILVTIRARSHPQIKRIIYHQVLIRLKNSARPRIRELMPI